VGERFDLGRGSWNLFYLILNNLNPLIEAIQLFFIYDTLKNRVRLCSLKESHN